MTSRETRPSDFVELFAAHQRQVFGYLLALLRNVADAEDVLQQTSLTLWEKFDEFQPGTDFTAWACQIAKYKAQNFLRAKRRSRLCFSDELTDQLADTRTALAAHWSQRREAFAECLEKLGRSDQRLLQLCYDGERTTQDAAREVGRPVMSVYQSLRRIRRSLLECVERRLTRENRDS